MQTKDKGIFTNNILKVIACISMFIDHLGYIFFPRVIIFRIIGRLAFPLFAYMIAEGTRYTKSKVRYFFSIFGLAVVCQIVYFIVERDLYLNTLMTFSISILLIYSLQYFKEQFCRNQSIPKMILSGILFIILIAGVYVLNIFVEVDYGFFGCILPVFASILHGVDMEKKGVLDNKCMHILAFSIGLLLLCLFSHWTIQYYSFISVILLLLYNGTRGRYNIKYFFYIFYPLHLAVLYGIFMLF